MYSRLSRVANWTGMICLTALIVFVSSGCSSMSPFTSMAFATNLSGMGSGSPSPSPDDPVDPNVGYTSVCDLDEAQRVIAVALFNESEQFVRFSMTFVASAGPGGFVCDDELQSYINAGYSEALIPGSGNTVSIGCDTLTLQGGNQLLTLEFGINQGDVATLQPNPEGNTSDFPNIQLFTRGSTISPAIPLPEMIVFGSSDADFTCTGADLCSQRGFVYSSAAGLPVGNGATAARIQGTICNGGFGTAPEWRLDKNLQDGQTAAYQFMPGGAIAVSILDRASDDPNTETRNQVVWLVTNSSGNTVHAPVR